MRIVIVAIKDDELLHNCLDSLKKYSPEVPIDLLMVNPKECPFDLLRLNEYIKTAEDDIMVWHPDMVATEGWYEQLKKYYDVFDVAGTKLIYPDGIIGHYGGAIRPDGSGYHPHQYSLNIGLNEPLTTAYVTGPGKLIKKEVLKKIRWDEDTYRNCGFYCDTDFCFQAREAGFKVGVIPVTLIHVEGQHRDRRNEKEKILEGWSKFRAKWMHVLGELR